MLTIIVDVEMVYFLKPRFHNFYTFFFWIVSENNFYITFSSARPNQKRCNTYRIKAEDFHSELSFDMGHSKLRNIIFQLDFQIFDDRLQATT